MRRRICATWQLLACLAIAVVGCQQQGASPPPTAAIAAVEAASTPADDPALDEKEDQSESVESTEAEGFDPPFPDRVDLFVPPARARVVVRDDNNREKEIVLRGFISPAGANSPIVLLAIDGVESHVAEGEELFGIRVMSIKEPSVTLQRGRYRWTETLQDPNSAADATRPRRSYRSAG